MMLCAWGQHPAFAAVLFFGRVTVRVIHEYMHVICGGWMDWEKFEIPLAVKNAAPFPRSTVWTTVLLTYPC